MILLKRFSYRHFGLLVLAAIVGLAGCAKKERDTDIGIETRTLLYGNGGEPEDLDPHIITGVPEHHITMSLFEGLTSPHPKDLHAVPGVAKSWDISEDGLTYTFHLREDAAWSNGDPLTTKDFLFSIQRVLSPKLAAQYAYMLFMVENAEAYNSGEITDFSKVGVKALDAHTLQITLSKPTPAFLEIIYNDAWYPVHQGNIEAFGEPTQRGLEWTRPGNLISNGPFKLSSWDVNQRIVVVRNPLYWDNETTWLESIHFLPIASEDVEDRSFRNGLLHITYVLPLHRIDYYKAERPEQLRLDPSLATYYYILNTTKKPLDDVRVRKALSMAIDRKELTVEILRAGQQPAFSFVPPGTAGYQSTAQIEYNPEKARELLAEAGYPNGEGFPDLEILYNTMEAHKTIAEVIQNMWKEELGIDIGITNEEWKVYLDTREQLNHEIARAGWNGDYIDPVNFLDLFYKDGGNNHTGWWSTQYEDLINKGSASRDPAERLALYQEAEAILLDELPIIPLYFYVRYYLIDPRVKGWYPTLLDRHPYKYVSFETE